MNLEQVKQRSDSITIISTGAESVDALMMVFYK
jgi:hypothetical protein